jgi:ERF superfamily
VSDTLNLWQRIGKAQAAVDYIQKEKKSGMNYSIVSHDAVTAKVRPVLVENGVLYYPVDIQHSQDGNRTQVKLTVRFVNVDKPEEHFDVPSLGYGIDSQDKGPGKAISYAVKYALLKTLGLETGDDPDLDQNAKHEPPVPMQAANGTIGASKAANRQAYDRLVREIRNATGKAALEKIYRDNITEIDALPPDFLDELRVEYNDRLSELKQKAAA